MAHFAKLNENNEVIAVLVVNNESLDPSNEEQSGIDFLNSLFNDGSQWIQTSYNGNIRYNFAGIGMFYDPIDDAFIAPQPFPSWILNSNKRWEAPLPYPQDDKMYVWNEKTQSWDEMA